MTILIVSNDYPGNGQIYTDVFVHARARLYSKSHSVQVLGIDNSGQGSSTYQYEGISVHKTDSLSDFEEFLTDFKTDLIVVHFMSRSIMPLLLRVQRPIVVFVHGYEILSWKRRLMNYRSLGDLPYLLEYIKENSRQLNAFKKFVHQTNANSNVQFVFVSKWLQKAAEKDLGTSFLNGQVIPNGIDLDRFVYQKKDAALRKKVLVLRSFKARNYANDIAVQSILELSKRSFFDEFEFTIYGEGYLFNKVTQPIRHFKNVRLINSFIENKEIPHIHQAFGVFLCPSRFDTQGVSMCEAMASGLVPITSPIGGIPEYADNDKSSFQVTTAEEIADRIELLYHQPEVFLKMSEEAHSKISNTCSLKSTVQSELDLFKKISNSEEKTLNEYTVCTRCVLDNHDDSEISFDTNGICSYCQNYDEQEAKYVKKGEQAERELSQMVDRIKQAGIGKPYDCIIGISGGVDSTYLALKAKEFGLRPLAVHFDNGWNSELAVHNIENIINRLGFDLKTFVVDWDEFRDIQLSFLKASVVDIELVTDHAILTKLYQLAIDNNIKYILSGANVVTEAILPKNWIHDKRDHVNIRSIHKIFGMVPLKTYPLFTSYLKWKVIWKGVKSVTLLDLLPYKKEEVKRIISTELGWRDYGGKHYESVFTRFYQGYILPVKFGIDKRKAHLSNLICSDQITKAEAIEELTRPGYEEPMIKADYAFVLKKFGLTKKEFEDIMKLPIKRHSDYDTERSIYDRFPILKLVRPVWKKLKFIKQTR